jgi:hypothetical protein
VIVRRTCGDISGCFPMTSNTGVYLLIRRGGFRMFDRTISNSPCTVRTACSGRWKKHPSLPLEKGPGQQSRPRQERRVCCKDRQPASVARSEIAAEHHEADPQLYTNIIFMINMIVKMKNVMFGYPSRRRQASAPGVIALSESIERGV